MTKFPQFTEEEVITNTDVFEETFLLAQIYSENFEVLYSMHEIDAAREFIIKAGISMSDFFPNEIKIFNEAQKSIPNSS